MVKTRKLNNGITIKYGFDSWYHLYCYFQQCERNNAKTHQWASIKTCEIWLQDLGADASTGEIIFRKN